jgi:hypothetical protein
MANNKMSDLNDHLFCQLERLNDDEHMKMNADSEIKRAKAMSIVAKQVIENAKVVVVAAKLAQDFDNTEQGTLNRIIS